MSFDLDWSRRLHDCHTKRGGSVGNMLQRKMFLAAFFVAMYTYVRHICNMQNDDGYFHDQQLVTARDAAALVHSRQIIIAPCPHALVSGLEPSPQSSTRASSPLTNFPKQDSHHPMHPYPNIPVICAPRPHAYESVASSHARHLSPCAHACPRTPRSISVTNRSRKKSRNTLDHSCRRVLICIDWFDSINAFDHETRDLTTNYS